MDLIKLIQLRRNSPGIIQTIFLNKTDEQKRKITTLQTKRGIPILKSLHQRMRVKTGTLFTEIIKENTVTWARVEGP